MRALDRKLLRDLWQTRSQALAISAVIASGIALLVMSLTSLASLKLTQSTYYERYRFADVFASLERAPERIAEHLARIPGVEAVETRVGAIVTLDLPDFEDPAVARLLSIPERRRAMLNDVFLRSGRYIDGGRPDEILVSEGFAEAHGLGPGDSVRALINGRSRRLRIVGVALSPEFVYTIRPGEMLPDDSRFAVFWMGRKALATAFDLDGSFNDVSLALARDASVPEVLAQVEASLERYGGQGVFSRRLQTSHWYRDNEIKQLSGMALIIPIIFLAVAAFLLNVVLGRLLAVQRTQIAALKALGYSNGRIALHYVQWAGLVGLLGSLAGVGVGAWMGSGLTRLYTRFFRFPFLEYSLPPGVIVAALAVGFLAAVLGAFGSVRRAVALPPAEAMRPEPPARFRKSVFEVLGVGRLLSQPARIVLRNLSRRPLRTSLGIFGIAMATALPVVGTFSLDSFGSLTDFQFGVVQRQDATVTFVLPTSGSALHELRRLPGVVRAEPFRAVAARLRAEHRSRQVSIMGIEAGADLNRVVTAAAEPVVLPPTGLVLSKALATLLGVQAGDEVFVEVQEGGRPRRSVRIAALVDELMGINAYMDLGALRRLMREGPVASGAFVAVDESLEGPLYARLKVMPRVAGTALITAALEGMQESIGENMRTTTFFNVLFSTIIAFGVVYNSARIALSERGRELASLRVIGFSRREISFILLGELALITLVAIPLGLLLGYGLAGATLAGLNNELYRLPLRVAPSTFAFAACTVLVASVVSGLVVRRRLDHLDLIAVLKTRE